jgi:hypothetical protein
MAPLAIVSALETAAQPDRFWDRLFGEFSEK